MSHHFHPHTPGPVTFLLLSYCRYCKHISLTLMTGMLLLFASPVSSYDYKFLQIFYLRETRKFYIPLHPAESYPEDLCCTPQKYCIIPSKSPLLPHSLSQSNVTKLSQNTPLHSKLSCNGALFCVFSKKHLTNMQFRAAILLSTLSKMALVVRSVSRHKNYKEDYL